MDRKQVSKDLREMQSTNGWKHVSSWIKDDIADKTEELVDLMEKHPDLVDKKKGYSFGLTIKAYRNLLDFVEIESRGE